MRLPAKDEPVRFTDVTAAAGIHFVHNSGRDGKKWLPETMGSGGAFLDTNGDGWLDILLINGKDWAPRGRRTTAALYHNNHNGTFTDITRGSGLDIEIYGLGVAVGDYDNDGREDIYITALGGDHLFRNQGGGHFRDVTRESGIQNANFGSSAAWLDYDRDGKLDLFVANYVQWSAKGDLWCSLDGSNKSYCTPESYKGNSSKLYRNLGGGKFEDATEKVGLADPTSKSLGVAVFDYNNDGWPDLFISNDTQPNKLYRNLKNGRFQEEGLASGVAFGEDGVARGAMGVDAADYDRSGRAHLIVGNFSNQMLGLYHNEGNGLFVDEAPRSTVGRASLLTLTFGLFFFDYDLDGYPDILAANGHIEEQIGRIQPKIQYAETPLLLRNQGHGKFEQVNAFTRPMVARGAAYGDFDHDGDLDVLLTTNNGPAYLYRNDGGNRNHWLQLKLIGTKSNRSAIGAVARLTSAGGTQWQTVHSGSSYCSASDLTLTFGLGKDAAAAVVEIAWPSGARQKLTNVAADKRLVLREP
ncbi:MAG: CRTAC1 family protein [Acidobacteriota bacterium]